MSVSFSISSRTDSSVLITPSMGCVAYCFMNRRGLASGIAFLGGGFGGVRLPLVIQSILPQVGWGWSIRVLGLVLLMLCAMSMAFCRSRVTPRKGAATTWQDTLPDPRSFMDGAGAMAATSAGDLFVDLAYFIPIHMRLVTILIDNLCHTRRPSPGQRRSHINFSRASMLLHALAGTRRVSWLTDSADTTI